MTFLNIIYSIIIGPLKLLFEVIFSCANKVTNNPGLTIISLSLSMNLLILPLYMRADALQEEERDIELKLAAGVAHIKKTFKGDERMMMLQTYYRQNNYKPTYVLRGAMSLFLEIPFFIAAYKFLSTLPMLIGVSFGPIADLGKPDGLIVIGCLAINVLPILMTAINAVSTAIFTKGYPAKTKIQLYAMSLFFLVFLYDSPAGLVFYWTLNNLFSLVKTIFYKLKNPKKVLTIMASAVGIIAVVFGCRYWGISFARTGLFIGLGLALQIPVCLRILNSKNILNKNGANNIAKDTRLFAVCGLFLTILLGGVIPTAVLTASPTEFVNVASFYNPLWYVASALCLAIGTFIVWINVFYRLSSDKSKPIIENVMSIFAVVAVADYMFFGKKIGILLPSLKYENQMIFSAREKIMNLLCVAVVVVVIAFVLKKRRKLVADILLIGVLAFSVMLIRNVVIVNGAIKSLEAKAEANNEVASISLSKDGNNVVFIMLDRAMGELIPYIMTEKPELKDVYEGFTYYEDVLSYGGHTIIGGPATYGGYEYTPDRIDARADETLVSKHNEALKVLPVLFAENGYNVTVCDPPYANYEWTPDLSIYDEYPEINAYITKGAFTDEEISAKQIEMKNRNFFCYSLTKVMPLVVQGTIYEDGNYHNLSTVNLVAQTISDDLTKAEGLNENFSEAYAVLEELPNMTTTVDDSSNNFLMLTNDTTHEQQLLQKDDYSLQLYVDNTEYVEANKKADDSFEASKRELIVTDWEMQAAQYHSTMAALIKVGEWLEYLKSKDVYDNTRIILVSDHGYNDQQLYELLKYNSNTDVSDLEAYLPLLMFKDYGASEEFTVSSDFMTNADAPYLAVKDIIDNPVNPFTGNMIGSDAYKHGTQYVMETEKWEPENNPGNQFAPARWFEVDTADIYNQNNWTIVKDGATLPY